ncbi:MAG: hypothetical protein K1X79_12060 [Oligoflexia bacterium]|nr:hypothetical protein [Oligoflexia bacterium]
MQEHVLSIDTTIDPPTAVLVGLEDGRVGISEIHELGVGAFDSTNENASTNLKSALERIKKPFHNTVLLVPSQEYLSMNVELPFSNPKSIEKVIDLEVQDQLPFDGSDFVLHYHPVGTLPTGSHDVHVGLLPTESLRRTLATCKAAGCEPLIVSTNSGILGALDQLRPQLLPDTAVVILPRAQDVAIALFVAGKVCSDRVIPRRLSKGTQALEPGILHDLRLTVAAWEKRYKCKVNKALLIGVSDCAPFEQTLAIPVSPLSPQELVGSSDDRTISAGMAAIFARDNAPPVPLTNFRTRQFSYRPQLAELLLGLRQLIPFSIGLLVLVLIALSATYAFREQRISRVQAAMRQQITESVPSLSLPQGHELDALEGETRRLEQQLQSLGSLSALSPLDYLTEITGDLPLASGVTVTRVKIEGNRLRVEGSAPGYTEIEKIERFLKRKKNVYCKIRKDSTNAAPGKPNSRGYTLDITLCE